MDTQTDITVLDNLMAINLDVSIWTARKKLTPADFGGAALPPDDLASLGSKKVCDPKELRIFGTLKARAINLLDRTGVRFLGGWGIPEGKADDIVAELTVIRDDFMSAKEQFLNRYDEAVKDWISQHPGWESLIGGSTVGADYVRSRLDFRWQLFKLVPPTDNAVGYGLQDEVKELGGTLFDEVAKAAADTWKRCFEGKDKVTHKALSPLRSIHAKLAGLSFVEPRVVPIVDLLDTAFNRMPKRGHIEVSELAMLQGVVSLLRDPATLVAHGQKIIEGQEASDILAGLVAGTLPVPSKERPSAKTLFVPGRCISTLSIARDSGEVIMTNNLIMKSLPMVASVLGRKYGVKVVIGGKDAYTDGNTIHLPALPLECSETLIGLARGYIDHEAAHIRETRFDWLRLANLTPLEMHVWNIFEDWRVEHRLARLFPGCRSNFNWLIRHLFGDASENTTDPAMAILNWLLLSVRAWDVPSLNGQRDDVGNFVESHYPGLIGRLNHVLKKVHAYCDSTQDCILYAREVVSLLKEKVASLPRQNGESKTGKSGKNGVSDELPLDALNRLIQADDIDLPKDLGDALAASLRKETPKDLNEALRVARLGTKTTKPLAPEDVTATKRASIALRMQLQGLLQSSVLTRSKVGRHGRLDARQLHRVSVADARVFKRAGRKVGINTAVHILLDCSGSMRRRIKLTTQVCHAVAKALDAIDGINVAVTVFPAGAPSDGGNENDRAPTVCPILRHGERMHGNFALSATGCTPLGEALWWTLQQVVPLSESRKIILILTDGDPDSFHVVLDAIEEGRRFGVEIYGLGITSEAITKLLPDHSRTINDLLELAPAMFGMLRGALVK